MLVCLHGAMGSEHGWGKRRGGADPGMRRAGHIDIAVRGGGRKVAREGGRVEERVVARESSECLCLPSNGVRAPRQVDVRGSQAVRA